MIDKIWKSNNLISYLLLPLSIVYYMIYKIYRLYGKEKKCNIPVICIGNVTIGGAGKTPTVIKIRKLLSNNFSNIFVLTRGYKGKALGPQIVKKTSSFWDVGDESLLHCRYGPTCVSKNKFAGVKFLENLGCDLILMDDGLQSVDIKKDLKILVIDSNFGFGNKMLLPSGPLREKVFESVNRSHLILIIGKNKKFIESYSFPGEKVFFAQKEISIDKIKTKDLLVFSALGDNTNFHNSLMEKGYKLQIKKEFPDHHIFKKEEIHKILLEAENRKLSIICTEKDYIKVPVEFKKKITPVKMELKIERTAVFKQRLLKLLGN